MHVCSKEKRAKNPSLGVAAFKELGKNNMLLRVSDLHIIHMSTHPKIMLFERMRIGGHQDFMKHAVIFY